MTTRLMPYGASEQTENLSKVGKSKTPLSLAGRMPSAKVAAKVGTSKQMSPASLARRMPSAEIAAKVGMQREGEFVEFRVVRRKSKPN